MKHKSILRVWSDIFYDRARYEKALDYCKAHVKTIDEIIFFTQCSHSIRNVDDIKRRLDFIKSLMDTMRGRGVKLGIDVLCTIGHLVEFPDPSMKDHDFFMDANNVEHPGRLCPSSPKTMEYIRDVYSYAAATQPDTIHIDDDLHYGADCRCPRCERIYAETYSHLPNGRKLFTRDRLCAIFKFVEQTVHAVKPDIILGWMTCYFGDDGLDYSPYAEALKGNDGKVVWRPGGGVYNDESIAAMMGKAHSIGRQDSALPDYVMERYSEIENFPYAHLKKTTEFTAFEALAYLAAGCTGTAYNVLGYSGSFDENPPYLDLIDELDPMANVIVENAGCASAVGIGKPLPPYPAQSDVTIGDDLYLFGLPPAYNSRHSVCNILSGKIARTLDKSQLLDTLSHGVMLDGEALAFLNENGFEKYTGFSAEPMQEAVVEENLAHPLVPEQGILRDTRPQFGWTSPVFAIKKTADTAEYLTRMVTFGGQAAGYASGIFENELDGRIFASGYSPFNWLDSFNRVTFLKRIFRFLSHDKLPAFVASPHKVAIWCRDNCIVLANLMAGKASNVTLAANTTAELLQVFQREGSTIRKTTLAATGHDGPYNIFSLGDLAYQEILVAVLN